MGTPIVAHRASQRNFLQILFCSLGLSIEVNTERGCILSRSNFLGTKITRKYHSVCASTRNVRILNS
jgi:hypothetical protein